MSRLRVGCVGTGFIAGRHLRALSGFPDVDVVAVADPIGERAVEAAAPLAARTYSDGLDLLAAEDLDALWICVPPFAHGPLEEAALARDLPFFVEKPLACDLVTAERIAEQVERRGLLTAVGYHWRYLGLLDRVRAVVAQDPPKLVEGHWLDRTPAAPWWVRRELSGGQVLEQTTHLLDLARVLVGEVDDVTAVEVPAGRDGLAPLAACVTLRFRSGAIGTIASARFLHARHHVGVRLLGEGYAAELVERALVDHELRISTADGDVALQSGEDPIAAEDRAFLDAVLGRGDDVRAPYAEALNTHALAWAADRSAREASAETAAETAAPVARG